VGLGEKQMINTHLILMILALICFFCAAIGIVSGRVNLLALGLFLWVLDILIGGLGTTRH
jgi:preprotein translocase subunit SecE